MHIKKRFPAIMICIFFIILFIGTDAVTNSLPLAESTDFSENLMLVQKWQNLEDRFKMAADFIDQKLLSKLLAVSKTMNLTSECQNNLMQFRYGLRNLKPWALKIIDASAKTIDGISYGTFASYGSYDECVDIVATDASPKSNQDVFFNGKYCTIETSAPLPQNHTYYFLDDIPPEIEAYAKNSKIGEILRFLGRYYMAKLRISICIPSGCSLEDVDKVAKKWGNLVSFNTRALRCDVKEEHKLTSSALLAVSWYVVIAFLVFIGSLIDIYLCQKNANFHNKFVRALLSFSLVTNTKKFSNMDSPSNIFTCLHGVRVITLLWVILGHTYNVYGSHIYHGLLSDVNFFGNLVFQPLWNATFSVDTFFFIGGLLVCYWNVKLVKIEGHPFSLKVYIIHRLCRILPLYIQVLMLTSFIKYGSGPLFNEFIEDIWEGCDDTWWKNLLFINNYYIEKPCALIHTWYVAVDFQLYLCTLFCLLPLLRSPRVGITACIFGIIGSIFHNGITTYVNKLPPTFFIIHIDPAHSSRFLKYYLKPFPHVAPYCIGMLTGYLLAIKPNLKISPKMQALGWSSTIVVLISILYGTVWWNRGVKYTLLQSVLYASLSRVAWALGIAWMILCCATGHGGVINHILSWKMFIPLSKLTYAAYLLHNIIHIYVLSQIPTVLPFRHLFIVWMFLGNVCASYVAGFLFSMFFEVPSLSLEKIFADKIKKN